jgi:uncharacterized SAM-binding protein YcdF (DUF218 family)
LRFFSLRSFLIAAALVILLYLSRSVWCHWLGESLVKEQQPVKADAILVLGGDYTCGRVLKAAQLAHDGYAPRVIVSGGQPAYELQEPDLAIQCAVKHGFAADPFLPAYVNAFSTRDEAERLKPVLERLGIKRLLAVTSDFHTRRAGIVLRRTFGPGIEVTMVGVPDPYWSAGGWWKNREGQKTEFYEWSKTIAATIGW